MALIPRLLPATHSVGLRHLSIETTDYDLRALEVVERMRPPALRAYDQIPMRALDLLRQAKLMAPFLAERSVAFVGDSDGTSTLLGLLAAAGLPCPSRMLVLDFDERLLLAMDAVAREYGFADRLNLQLYNVFDPLSPVLLGQYDWFYTNPPYGCRNAGESARLFITRGCEVARPDIGRGCVIVPYASDAERMWTKQSMLETQQFLVEHGWVMVDIASRLHQYHLDDDQDLPSSTVVVEFVGLPALQKAMPHAGRAVGWSAIPHFYGKDVQPPYPRYIRADGRHDYDRAPLEQTA